METNLKKTNSGVVIVYIVIIALIIIFAVGIISKYVIKKNVNKQNEVSTNIVNSEENNNKLIGENNNQIITLSDKDKIKINKEIKEKLILALRKIANIQNVDLIYNTNLLNDEIHKFYIVWCIMEQDATIAKNFKSDDATGKVSIDKELVNTYYNKIFNSDMNEGVLQTNSAFPITIRNNILYVPMETGYGINPFELKANNLKFNNNTKIYTLTLDFLMEVKKEKNYYKEFNEDVSIKYGDANVLEWPINLNYAKLIMEYKKDTENNYQLISLMFVK